ncbi:MAG: hypothetical protein HQK54_03300 [Oligoflexales bacterium]|nr:hypothetical protein [Oligoflexales bacterium]
MSENVSSKKTGAAKKSSSKSKKNHSPKNEEDINCGEDMETTLSDREIHANAKKDKSRRKTDFIETLDNGVGSVNSRDKPDSKLNPSGGLLKNTSDISADFDEEVYNEYQVGSDDEMFSSSHGEIENDSEAGKTDMGELRINLSRSLCKKIKQQAQEEGLTVNEYIMELLSEGVVVRAWEIVERKNQMRGQAHHSVHSQSNSSRNSASTGHVRGHNNSRKGLHHRGGMTPGRYQAIMDDKASFLEYVRNQERNSR